MILLRAVRGGLDGLLLLGHTTWESMLIPCTLSLLQFDLAIEHSYERCIRWGLKQILMRLYGSKLCGVGKTMWPDCTLNRASDNHSAVQHACGKCVIFAKQLRRRPPCRVASRRAVAFRSPQCVDFSQALQSMQLATQPTANSSFVFIHRDAKLSVHCCKTL